MSHNLYRLGLVLAAIGLVFLLIGYDKDAWIFMALACAVFLAGHLGE